MLLLIKTSKNEDFGAFFDCPFDFSAKFQGSSCSFVFQLKPFEAIYTSMEINHCYSMVTQDKITIGQGSFGPAIELDKEFNKGTTCSCDTFNSPPLAEPSENAVDTNRVEFSAIIVEIFILQ